MTTTGTLLVHGARVHGVPGATSVAVRGERIVAVGRRTDVEDLAGDGTRILDRPNALICPGFHDGHAHLVLTGMAARELDLHDLEPGAIQAAIAAAHERTPPGSWVIAGGLSPASFPRAGEAPATLLDRWAPERPTLLRMHDHHGAVLNRRGLAAAGFAGPVPGAFEDLVEREADGVATGRVFEGAAWHAEALAGVGSLEERCRAVVDTIPALHRAGIVAVHEMSGSRDHDALRRLDAEGRLGVEVLATISPEHVGSAPRAAPGRRLRVVGMKAFLDGALGSSTAALLEPYEDDPAHAGVVTLSAADTLQAVRAATAAGLASCLHAIGNAAVRAALDAFAEAPLPHGPGPRQRVEHAQMIHDDDLPRFAQLGVVASIQPVHIAEDAPWVHRRWGARSRQAFPTRRLLDSGALVVFGSDAPIETIDILAGIRCAVRRTGRDGTELHREEAVSVSEAIDAYTVSAARAGGCADDFGSVAPGRLASLTLLDRDIVRAPAELDACRIAATIVRGDVVFAPEARTGTPVDAGRVLEGRMSSLSGDGDSGESSSPRGAAGGPRGRGGARTRGSRRDGSPAPREFPAAPQGDEA